MTHLAGVSDVKRILRRDNADTSQDDSLEGFLEAAEEALTQYLRCDWTLCGGSLTTESFYDVAEDSRMPVPLMGSTVNAIRFFRTATATAYTGIVQTDYEVDNNKRWIRLHTTMFDVPFEGARSLHVPEYWDRVEIDFTPPTKVPTPVREGCALTAGALYMRSPLTVGGLSSETLGDYSYSVRGQRGAPGDSAYVPDVAKELLAPYRRRTSMVP